MTDSTRIVLGADVGGTNTKVALAAFDGSRCEIIASRVYPSRRYPMLELVLEAFLADGEPASYATRIASACFAVAGPVEDGRARLTNLTWIIDQAQIARRFGFGHAAVINDFEAAGLGIEQLAPVDLLTLQAGTVVARADRVVVGAGTGLGVGRLTWGAGHYDVHPSEGGHSGFAPFDSAQDALLVHLRREFGHVSWERVLSGAGLVRVLDFLELGGAERRSDALARAMAESDPAGAVADAALAGTDPLAARALDLFAAAYGAFAGNMALVTLAHGGVYVAGGIAPKIASKLSDGTFVRAFRAKGRLEPVHSAMPIHVVMNDRVGLYGALAHAAWMAV
jgi:glucokinase